MGAIHLEEIVEHYYLHRRTSPKKRAAKRKRRYESKDFRHPPHRMNSKWGPITGKNPHYAETRIRRRGTVILGKGNDPGVFNGKKILRRVQPINSRRGKRRGHL